MSGKPVRLDRLLSGLGYGSRREIAALAKAGRIAWDGTPVRDGDRKVAAGPDLSRRLSVDGEPCDPAPGIVIVMNKPLGLVCSHKEAGPLVYDLLPSRWRSRTPPISSIGRLDKDTSGLLLLTDDGAFLHRVISPRSHVPKRYLADLARPLSGDEAERFGSGTLMLEGEDKPLAPAELEPLTETRARLTIHEGRYHQVRRMFAAVGNHVTALHREAIGGFDLPSDLAPGSWRLMQEDERAALFAAPLQSV